VCVAQLISEEKAEAERADQQQTPELELEQLSQPNTGNQGTLIKLYNTLLYVKPVAHDAQKDHLLTLFTG
jgi:hypothetical protein